MYTGPTKRIGLDLPEPLKLELDTRIPYGFLSELIRNLLELTLNLLKREGYQKGLKALISKQVQLTITEPDNED